MNMKQKCAEIMSEIESIQRQLGWVVETETHKERLKHPISEEDVRWYARELAQLKDNLNTHGPAIRCRTCNDRGWVKSQTPFGIFGFQNNEPCTACVKGQQIKRERDEKARKAKEEQEAREEQRRLAQAQEWKWRADLYKVCVEDVMKPIGHLLDHETISKLQKEYDYLYKRCLTAQSWYQDEQYHLNGTGDFSIPKLWEREARLAWVKETVPFGLKAHEGFYEIEGNLLLKVVGTQRNITHRIYETLPPYASGDELLEALYKQLQELVSQVLSDTDVNP